MSNKNYTIYLKDVPRFVDDQPRFPTRNYIDADHVVRHDGWYFATIKEGVNDTPVHLWIPSTSVILVEEFDA